MYCLRCCAGFVLVDSVVWLIWFACVFRVSVGVVTLW